MRRRKPLQYSFGRLQLCLLAFYGLEMTTMLAQQRSRHCIPMMDGFFSWLVGAKWISSDVVVSDQNGVVQYDHLKVETHRVLVRSAAAPPSAALLGKVRMLEAGRLAGKCPWEAHIARAVVEGAARPEASTDKLFVAGVETPHPSDSMRHSSRPRIHYGPIGSSNALLKDPEIRDALRDKFGIRAIEMEGSGIADGTWTSGLGYIVVRGVSDYCDEHKNDVWQGYAAVVAAAYARSLIESFTVITDPVTQRQLDEAKAKMKTAHSAVGTNDYQSAAEHSESAADCAIAAGDADLQRRALLQAVKAWGEYIACQRLADDEVAAITQRARKLLERLQALGERSGVIALEMAQLGRFHLPAYKVLDYVARAAVDKDPIIRAEALVIHLQTLWRTENLDAASELVASVTELSQQVPEDVRLVIEATWLRTLCKAGTHHDADVEAFVNLLDAMGSTSYQRIALVIGQVASEFNASGHARESRALCEAAYRAVVQHANAPMLTNIALQIAELSAQLGDAITARLYLGHAESWATRGHEDAVSARANVLFAKGRTLTRIADQIEPADQTLYREAYDALEAARTFGQQHRLEIQGQVDLFLADVSWWLGRTAVNLGRLAKACEYLRAVRSDAAMSHTHFRSEVVSRAWLLEAESLALSGRIAEAGRAVAAFVGDSRFSDKSKERARRFQEHLNERIRPLVDWFASEPARSIGRDCAVHGLRRSVTGHVAPLIAWWRDWHKPKGGAESELMDFWGRGGFAAVAAAVRMKPHAAIAVDATSVNEIRNWARVLCPLFDAVIIKWKGELGTGMVIVPQHGDYLGPGGHGYAVTSDRTSNKAYAVSMSWANPIPREVSSFLSGEALPMFSAGRLIVLPAPLVGCSQSAVGWTDNLLVEGLLGGIVDVTRNTGDQTSGAQRVLDLSRVKVPFIDNISMSDLATVLDDAERWTGPLRSHIMKVLASGDLNHERWSSIAGLEQEIQNASHELTEGLAALVCSRDWRVLHSEMSLAAGSRGPSHEPAHESITSLLQSVASGNRELTPWIPYWRLQDRGGFLNWTCALDNQSTPPDYGAMAHMAVMGVPKPAELHSWLYPGTPGWFFPTAIRIPVAD